MLMTQKPVVLITGAVSLLGKYRIRELYKSYTLVITAHHISFDIEFRNLVSYIEQTDITKKSEVERIISKYQPRYMVHLASLSNIDYCEKHPHEAYRVNLESVQNIVEMIKNIPVHFIFTSSSMVFSGDNAPYTEADIPHPINVYGKTKSAAEKIIQNLLPDKSTIIRSNTLFGWQPKRARSNDMNYYLNEINNGRPLNLTNRRFFNPLSADTAARIIRRIIDNNSKGIFHIGGNYRITRFEFVKKLIEAFDLKPLTSVHAVPNSFFPAFESRPIDTTLNIEKMTWELRINPPTLLEQLQFFKKEKLS